jgi:hypothetical protein
MNMTDTDDEEEEERMGKFDGIEEKRKAKRVLSKGGR